MISLKTNFSLDCLQSQTILLDHESCFKVFGPRIRVFRIEMPQKSLFPTRSISIGSRPINGVSRCLSLGLMFPASRLFRKAYFRSGRFPLVPGRPMGFRGVWVSDSSSPRRDTPGNLVSVELDFHWFPVDQWGFEVFGPRIHVPRIEIPQETLFPSSSISIGSRLTNGVSRCLDPGFVFLASSYLL